MLILLGRSLVEAKVLDTVLKGEVCLFEDSRPLERST